MRRLVCAALLIGTVFAGASLMSPSEAFANRCNHDRCLCSGSPQCHWCLEV